MAAEVERLAGADRLGIGAPADAVRSFEHHEGHAQLAQRLRRRQARGAGANDRDIRVGHRVCHIAIPWRRHWQFWRASWSGGIQGQRQFLKPPLPSRRFVRFHNARQEGDEVGKQFGLGGNPKFRIDVLAVNLDCPGGDLELASDGIR